MDDTFKVGKPYIENFHEWKALKEAESGGTLGSLVLVEQFANWLDRTKYLTPQMQLLAMIEARRVERSIMDLLISEVGDEKFAEIARPFFARYKRVDGQIKPKV